MVTCHLKYILDPYQIPAFEAYAKLWIPIVNRMGGTHHGYFLPSEGANNVAYALFSFPSLAAYEQYRADSASDPECIAAFALATEQRFILSYERNFLRPLLA
ncbi:MULTISPECIES: NIPSNAP family protein [Pseudomonas]|uniref:NIPSNAP family protein n=1 Tax=Pseudomonas farsensis TaxID=2745492 RepID=A0ABU8QXE1_9PSED|nr:MULTISPECIES: NIPSNAP family protein [Pseudomonas]MBC3413302.1 NIPSNAP family protein [Pseudomonas sp. SWRI51]MBV4533875.1 NIPSNAP family protein [Pseudomonas farsensis]